MVADHFADMRKVSHRLGRPTRTGRLGASRYACYLVIQTVTASQALGSYFAVQTRRQEMADDEALKEDKTRLLPAPR